MLGIHRLKELINKWREEDNLGPVTWHQCIFRQESLVAKSVIMSNTTEVVAATERRIRANALNHRKFKKFFVDIDADYGDMVMFIAVRWLSLATCFKRFYDFLPEIKRLPNVRMKTLYWATTNG